MPGTGSATGIGVVTGGGSVTSSQAPARTRSDLAGCSPSTSTSPAAISSAARVREKPNIRDSAASSRSPSSPSGTGRLRRSVTLALPRPVDLIAAPGQDHGQDAAAHDGRVGHVEQREVADDREVARQHLDEVDDVTLELRRPSEP